MATNSLSAGLTIVRLQQLPVMRKLLLQPARLLATTAKDASNRAQRQHRLAIFVAEKERQLKLREAAAPARTIEVSVPASKFTSFKLDAGATPMDVAKKLEESGGLVARESALAMLNEQHYWSMHRPIAHSCSIRFLQLSKKPAADKQEAMDRRACHIALWRSGAMLLGSLFETAFKEEFRVHLISSPTPHFPTGSFVYDCQVTKRLGLQHSVLQLSGGHCLSAWSPSQAELRALSRSALSLLEADAAFEWLDVPVPVALEMFKHNPYKLAIAKRAANAVMGGESLGSQASLQQQNVNRKQQPSTAREASVLVARVGDFVDLYGTGNLLARTGQISSLLVAAVHRIESPDFGPLTRIQGIAAADMSAAEVADWADTALEKASVLNVTYPPTKLPPVNATTPPPATPTAAPRPEASRRGPKRAEGTV